MRFLIEKRGVFSIKKSTGNQELDDEAIRVIRALASKELEAGKGSWIAGEKNGKPVSTEFVLLLVFKLDEKDKKATPDKQK